MPEVSFFAKCVVAVFIVVVVGVFVGLTLCASLHPTPVHEPFGTGPTCSATSANATPKCVRVVSTTPPSPSPTIVVTTTPAPSSNAEASNSSSANANAQKTPSSSSCAPPASKKKACPKAVYCPPCPKCPPPCPRMCPDMSKYVLKTSIPPCPEPKVDRDVYMLKSKCKQPDMSKYVLKSSLPSYKAPPCPPCVCKYEPNTSSPTTTTTTSDTRINAPTSPSSSDSPTVDENGPPPVRKSASKDLFGGDGLLGNSNMSAWNDTGATGGNGMGASLQEPSTITDSCTS